MIKDRFCGSSEYAIVTVTESFVGGNLRREKGVLD